MSSAFWTKLDDEAFSKVEKIEIEIDRFKDLSSILSHLNVFKELKILNVFIKLHEMEVEEKKDAIRDTIRTMKQRLPKNLKSSVKEILATFDSKENGTNEDDPEVTKSPDLKQIRRKVLIPFKKEAHQAPKFEYRNQRVLTILEKESNEVYPQFVQLGRHLLALRKPDVDGRWIFEDKIGYRFLGYLDFKSKIDWVDLEKKLNRGPKDTYPKYQREKKTVKHLTLDNVQKSESSAIFWERVFKVAPKVEEIEIGMDSHFGDLPDILSNLGVFKELKILNVFIKIQKMVFEEKDHIIQDTANTIKQKLPEELKASVREILASFDPKEISTNKNELEVPEDPDLKQERHKVFILFEKEADCEDPLFVQVGPYYKVVEEKIDDLGRQLNRFRQKQSKLFTYLDFESEINWIDVDLSYQIWLKRPKGSRGKKIIKHLTLDNVQNSESSAIFWEKVFKVAPKVEEIEIGMDGHFRDLPYILSKLNVFKELKILTVFIKIQEIEFEELKRSIILDAIDTMKQDLPKKLKASVMEILASFDSKEEGTNEPKVVIRRKNPTRIAKSKKTNDLEVPENGSADNSKEKVTNKDDPNEVDEDEEISFKVPTKKDDPEIPENGSADNSKEKVTNKDDFEVPKNGSADNSKEKVTNIDDLDEDEEISFNVPTNKDDPEVPENGFADNSKEKVTNKDDPEVPENGSADNSKEKVTNKDDPEVPENGSADNSRGEYYFLIR